MDVLYGCMGSLWACQLWRSGCRSEEKAHIRLPRTMPFKPGHGYLDERADSGVVEWRERTVVDVEVEDGRGEVVKSIHGH